MSVRIARPGGHGLIGEPLRAKEVSAWVGAKARHDPSGQRSRQSELRPHEIKFELERALEILKGLNVAGRRVLAATICASVRWRSAGRRSRGSSPRGAATES
jgi:hypothetical protein